MKMAQTSTEPSEEPNSKCHWIETLFQPHFTFQDLLTGPDHSTDKPRVTPTRFMSVDQPFDPESRRQVYMTTLKEVQHNEALVKRRNLVQRISRDEQPIDRQRPPPDVQHEDSGETPHSKGNGEDRGLDRCIWNKEDISQLRMVLSETERDMWRLRERLRSSEEQLNSERETRTRLQALLEDREGQLETSRQEAARHSLVVRALKKEAYITNIRLQELAAQSWRQAEEARRLRAELREAEERSRQETRRWSGLAWELETAQGRERTEAAQQTQAVRVEYEAAVGSLQRQVEEARTALREEEENHGRSRTALEVLRRHLGERRYNEIQECPTLFQATSQH
ncbi:coiled-coil domain containing 160 [Brachyhypopomus gauderio]|uniref:coiled-coil domain containing 160 n=1 Tax=Brachyhypopomus gauderio TaxID=698409 RepID=UPI004043642B